MPCQTWASWGPPMPLHMKWWIEPIGLSPSLEIVSEEGRCHETPMWPCSPAPTYWHSLQNMCSCPLFTAIKKTKKVEAKIPGGDADLGIYTCLS